MQNGHNFFQIYLINDVVNFVQMKEDTFNLMKRYTNKK
jgi:hypothetical protein